MRRLFQGGTVVAPDGTMAAADVVIDGDHILEVGSGLDGDEMVDVTGKHLLPGLFDCHIHVGFPHIDFVGLARTPPGLLYYEAIDSLQKTIDCGITTIRDAGGSDLGMKLAVERGIVPGLIGMMVSGLTRGKLAMPGKSLRPHERVPGLDEYYKDRISSEELARLRKECDAKGVALHGELMDRAGWPEIPFDGEVLVSHQDALLLGGKVQAPPGYADHVVFPYPNDCETCGSRICVEMCSGQAIYPGEDGLPAFDREKCVHCGACIWNCEKERPGNPERSLVDFHAGTGGLHSAEN